MVYCVEAAVVRWISQRFGLYGDRGNGDMDLHAGVSTCDYEYFPREIGEGIGMKSHLEMRWNSSAEEERIQCLELS